MIRKRAYRFVISSLFAYIGLMPLATAQISPLWSVDAFYKSCSSPVKSDQNLFTSEAFITVVRQSEEGIPDPAFFSPQSYLEDFARIDSSFHIRVVPVVLLEREYGSLATYYLSVASIFTDRKSNDTIVIKSTHSIVMINQNGWKIHSLMAQQEKPDFPFPKGFWPDELTKKYREVISQSAEDYDPNMRYNVDQVDIAPEYTAKKEVYSAYLQSYGVLESPSEDLTPFTIYILEDGLAELGYVGDLSEKQIEKATSFVGSMLLWYPAVKDGASVECKLIFYIK